MKYPIDGGCLFDWYFIIFIFMIDTLSFYYLNA